ncbi:GNAT family N-acetyltransferase [Streptomyces sp. DSM 44917]|uniref:GNAT family N-acetyltransferase n=1 Tax=Streptomyces boetiae TaxID=3075541 RepID=A0ABU2L8T9_9ACTN|nr:GNAT family N-acetyltransferase [Streptomyces sp. DSM 44917]MDT0307886.1 GNAT family N-acetyltransferase [Streptomyces sp. DSM 44917]
MGSETITRIREATPGDAEFLTRMLLAALNWGEEEYTREQALADPALAVYVEGWPRPGDLGVVAEDAAGEPAGAAWARRFTAEAPGDGFVAPDVPELAVAIEPAHRGRGLGPRLLNALLRRAEEAGVERISLSVDDGNPAARLYERLGFVTVGRGAGDEADTMLLRLADRPRDPRGDA